MAQQVPLQNSILLLCIVIVLTACEARHDHSAVPTVWLDTAGNDIITKGGITYHKGAALSGNVYALCINGDTVFNASYYQGKQEGKEQQWYENKQLKEIRYFSAGRKEGEHRGWFKNGRPRFIHHFSNDVYEGNIKEWFENGKLFKNFNYTNGQENGMQQMYWEDGKLRANYQVVDGRQYGHTGVKNCVSVWSDSVGH